MSANAHPLFAEYPLQTGQTISTGPVPTPYQTYDGHGLLLGGTADYARIAALLNHEDVQPMRTAARQALMAFWVVDFTAASLGPHHELQISFLVSHGPAEPVADHPLSMLKALFANPAARMFCYRLWNNSATVVAYNRELLGLDSRLSQGAIIRSAGRKEFMFQTAAGQPLVEGAVGEAGRTPPAVGWSLLRLMGIRQTMRALRQPWLPAKVVNPISKRLPFNGDAQTYLASEPPVVQWFEPGGDKLVIHEPGMAGLGFQPLFCEHFAPFRFVYLGPERPAGST